ncbi:MAG: hypothetical protein AABW85_04495, partial [archaeon]
IEAQRQRVAAIREELASRIPNPGPWARICKIYNFNPRSEQDISVIKTVNVLVQKYNTPPERVLYTLEKHLANQTEAGMQAQLTALNNAIAGAKSNEERKRIEKVKSIVLDVVFLKDKRTRQIILGALSTEGSHNALRAEFGFKD